MTYYNYYYELCKSDMMYLYPSFFEHLGYIQDIIKNYHSDKIKLLFNETIICDKCHCSRVFRLGNILWADNIKHLIEVHHKYPSQYFVKIIINTKYVDNYVINPPICINNNDQNIFYYIQLHYNKLLIIDALMNQGSYPRYESDDKFVYAEHSGFINIKNKSVDKIIILTDNNRIDKNDSGIFLPFNKEEHFINEFMFHTHPNTISYGGRIRDGILYEFPSANDVLHFIKYYNDGKLQASIVITPEGSYVIRCISCIPKINYDYGFFNKINDYIIYLEKKSIIKFSGILKKISDPDIFHNNISKDYNFIKKYNRFIRPLNIFIEYYPRIKKNNEWCLQKIDLQYIEK